MTAALSSISPLQRWTRRAGLFGGPAGALLTLLTLSPTTLSEATPGSPTIALTAGGIAVLALCIWMAAWWVTECIPLEATGLLPLVLLPYFGVCSFKVAAAPYADDVIGLFLGGMLLGRTVERWNVHLWLGGRVSSVCGPSPRTLVLGLLGCTAFISMWVSNLAAAIMMLPIARSLTPPRIDATCRDDTAIAFTLAVAFGASIGGVGTLIGTPPTAQYAAFMADRLNDPVSFLNWLMLGVPVVIGGVLGAWFILTRVAFRVPKAAPLLTNHPAAPVASFNRLSGPGWRTLFIFGVAVTGWILVPLLKKTSFGAGLPGLDRISDTGVSLTAVLLMFLIPAGSGERRPLLVWSEAAEIPWGILIMFGGGLSLAAAIQSSGLDRLIAHYGNGLGSLPIPLLVVVFTVAATLLSELMSNTALTALLLPIASAIALRIGVHPSVLMVPVVLGASLAFMMPAGTPPNAVAFATGRVTIADMIRGGLWLNVLFCTLTSVLVIIGYHLKILPGL